MPGQRDGGTTYTETSTATATETATYTASGSSEERAARVRFRRAVALMTMTLVLPGSAQVACGNRRVGRAALRLWFALLIVALGCLLAAGLHHEFAFWMV